MFAAARAGPAAEETAARALWVWGVMSVRTREDRRGAVRGARSCKIIAKMITKTTEPESSFELKRSSARALEAKFSKVQGLSCLSCLSCLSQSFPERICNESALQ